MVVVSNIFNGALLAPLVTILGAVSLATLQRSIEWITSIAKNPQKGYLRQFRPYAKNIDEVIDKILGGSKFSIGTTQILLMSIVILLLCLVLENAEKPKRVVVVGDKKKSDKSD